MTIDQIRLKAVNAGSSALNISGNELISILNSIPASGGGSSQWDDVTGGINYADGNVGINKAAPTVALDVVGSAQIEEGLFSVLNPSLGTNDPVFTVEGLVCAIGDYNANFFNTFIMCIDANKKINISAFHVNISQLQNFATNAAAITGGLVAGDLFYTNVAGEATLKIVI